MLSIPEQVRTLLKSGSIPKNFRVHFPNGELEDITNTNLSAESVKLTESLCSQDEFKFGVCEIPSIEFTTCNIENITGDEIECSLEIDCSTCEYETLWAPTKWVPGMKVKLVWDEAPLACTVMVSEALATSPYGYQFKTVFSGLISSTSYEFTLPDPDDGYAYTTGCRISVVDSSYNEKTTSGSYCKLIGWYSIPYGTFTVDSCKKTDSYGVLRDVTAYNNSLQTVFASDYVDDRKQIKSRYNATYKYDVVKRALSQMTGIYDALSWGTRTPDGTTFSDSLSLTSGTITLTFSVSSAETSSFAATDDYLVTAKGTPARADVSKFADFVYEAAGYAYAEAGGGLFPAEWKEYIYSTVAPRYYGTYFATYKSWKTGTTYETLKKVIKQGDGFYPYFPANSSDQAQYTSLIAFPITLLCSATNSSTSETVEYSTAINNKPANDCFWVATDDILGQFYFSEARKKVGTAYKITADFDAREMIEAALELVGKFGRIDRNGMFTIFDISDNFGRFPSTILYPGTEVYPKASVGETINSGQYESLTHEESPELPYGAVCCAYNDSSEGAYTLVYCDGFSEDSDPATFQIYDVSENKIITANTWTDSQMEALVSNLAGNIAKVKYTKATIEGIGRPDIEPGDIIIVKEHGSMFNTIVLTRTLSGINALKDSLEA